MTTDRGIHEEISSLVAEEHELRRAFADGEIEAGEEHERLKEIEVQLDQCWDLLRQRQALQGSGLEARDDEWNASVDPLLHLVLGRSNQPLQPIDRLG